MIFRRRRKDDEIPAAEAEDTTETDLDEDAADAAEPTTRGRGTPADEAAETPSWTSTRRTRATGAAPDPGT